jgi:hypothetical protein
VPADRRVRAPDGLSPNCLERRHRATIDDGTVRLFVELENTPLRQRRGEGVKRRSRELATRLGLLEEWFSSATSVLDRERAPCHPRATPRTMLGVVAAPCGNNCSPRRRRRRRLKSTDSGTRCGAIFEVLA